MLSAAEVRAIEGTNRFFKELTDGLVSPGDVNDRIVELAGPIPDDENESFAWESAIIGTTAHLGSELLGTFPVIILDYWPHTGRSVARIAWKTEKPPRRPKTPHCITDAFIIRAASRRLGEAAVSNKIVVLPMIADHEGRKVFEVGLLAVFPVWGAWAWRRKINITRRSRHRYDEERYQVPSDEEELERWIVNHIGMMHVGFEPSITEQALHEGSSATIYFAEELARKYYKG
jgi:hypothetical protein